MVPPVAIRSSTSMTLSPGLKGVLVQLDRSRAVFQFVVFHQGVEGQFALLAHQHQRGVQLVGQRRADNEAPGIDGGNRINLLAMVAMDKGIDQFTKSRFLS